MWELRLIALKYSDQANITGEGGLAIEAHCLLTSTGNEVHEYLAYNDCSIARRHGRELAELVSDGAVMASTFTRKCDDPKDMLLIFLNDSWLRKTWVY